ncbi:inhibitory synaptic factor 1 [Misgurnus anguillicaudatus]|uniref:inhibitory synaptic factor 1 n=1 Tax=Misgurnus anguillicaudatus TaxID=75329 RepID=UPI003CCF9B2D
MFHSAVTGPKPDLIESPDRRAEIRRHVKMVMEQLEEVLAELKDVAKELREVVAQIDKLTSDIHLDPEDDLTFTCCSEDHMRSPDDLFHAGMFSSIRDLSKHVPLLDPTAARKRERNVYHKSCGDLPGLNGPLKPQDNLKASWLYGSGGRIHYYDKTLYHALCCDDDDDDEDRGGMRSSRLSSTDSVFSSSPRLLTPTSVRKAHRSCSTQTVSDKSTQTHFPYMPSKDLDYRN